MFVNLTDVLTNEGRTITVQAEPELERVTIGDTVFPVKDIAPTDLTCTNIGRGKARVTGSTKITIAMNCDRCLKSVDRTLELQFDREVFAPDMTDTIPDGNDDQEFMDGCQLNVEDLLNIEIVINWPMKILCKPDCRGICRQCGKDLNTGTCDCDTFVPDPRMAVIKDIFNGNKEV
ncbi:MAG: DUF177 domain-containing protein [Lachnospiraceae bacterium]|nr:DUF177 domain-containing protein [Lachnospiraceae bacterium]